MRQRWNERPRPSNSGYSYSYYKKKKQKAWRYSQVCLIAPHCCHPPLPSAWHGTVMFMFMTLLHVFNSPQNGQGSEIRITNILQTSSSADSDLKSTPFVSFFFFNGFAGWVWHVGGVRKESGFSNIRVGFKLWPLTPSHKETAQLSKNQQWSEGRRQLSEEWCKCCTSENYSSVEHRNKTLSEK